MLRVKQITLQCAAMKLYSAEGENVKDNVKNTDIYMFLQSGTPL